MNPNNKRGHKIKTLLLSLIAITTLSGCGDPIQDAMDKAQEESQARMEKRHAIMKNRHAMAKAEEQSPAGIERRRVQKAKVYMNAMLYRYAKGNPALEGACGKLEQSNRETFAIQTASLAKITSEKISAWETIALLDEALSQQHVGNMQGSEITKRKFMKALNHKDHVKRLKKSLASIDQSLADIKKHCPNQVTLIVEGHKNLACAAEEKHPSCWRK